MMVDVTQVTDPEVEDVVLTDIVPLPHSMRSVLGLIAITPVYRALLPIDVTKRLLDDDLVEVTDHPFGIKTYDHLQITSTGCNQLAAWRKAKS